MKLILFKRFTKLSLARAAFWLATGVGLLIMPELGFLLNGAFYALIGCLLVNAVLRAVFFVRETNMERGRDSKAERTCRYISLAVAVLFAAAAVHLIIFREWLNEVTGARGDTVFCDSALRGYGAAEIPARYSLGGRLFGSRFRARIYLWLWSGRRLRYGDGFGDSAAVRLFI